MMQTRTSLQMNVAHPAVFVLPYARYIIVIWSMASRYGNTTVNCCACIHLCPVEAIQYGHKTKNRGRYRHPDLKIADMKVQRGE